MRRDELQLLLGHDVEVNPKRHKYLLQKWQYKGWHNGLDWTTKGNEEISIIKGTHDSKYIDKLDHHVVLVEFINWPPLAGILVDCGDNGLHFYTSGTMNNNFSGYYLGETYHLKDNDWVVSIRQHPNPIKIFNHLNYLG